VGEEPRRTGRLGPAFGETAPLVAVPSARAGRRRRLVPSPTRRGSVDRSAAARRHDPRDQRVPRAGLQSPDFTPIEQAFVKVKERLRRAGARTSDALVGAIRDAVAAVTPADARGSLAHGGYLLPSQLL
jgi:hypothetical protein